MDSVVKFVDYTWDEHVRCTKKSVREVFNVHIPLYKVIILCAEAYRKSITQAMTKERLILPEMMTAPINR